MNKEEVIAHAVGQIRQKAWTLEQAVEHAYEKGKDWAVNAVSDYRDSRTAKAAPGEGLVGKTPSGKTDPAITKAPAETPAVVIKSSTPANPAA